jgi:hypothetical protein
MTLVGAACALRACGDACLEPGCECECHPRPPIPSKVPDLRGVPLGVLPAPGGDEGPTFGSGI